MTRFLFPQPSSPTAGVVATAAQHIIQPTNRIPGAIPGSTTTAGSQVPATVIVPALGTATAALSITGNQTAGTSSARNSATAVGQASASPTGHPTHLNGAILMSPRYDSVDS